MNEPTGLVVPILSWWLAIQALGFVTLPLATKAFPFLPSRGYVLSKPLGLLLATYILWLGASLHWLPNTRIGIWVAVSILALISGTVGLAGNTHAGIRGLLGTGLAWLRANWPLVLASELLFFAALTAGILWRAYFPELLTGEKRMELAFINAILNSRYFPPQDPWLAGYPINYYYFGYVMVSLLIRITNVMPEVGFNLAAGAWIGLTLLTGFAVAYDLVASAARSYGMSDSSGKVHKEVPRAIGWGFVGAILIGVIGNLQPALMFFYQIRWLPEGWTRWLDLRWLTAEPATGHWSGGSWWWYRATGVITDRDVLGIPIDTHSEFPSLSFIIGDLHAHVLGLPFLIFALALALNLYLAARRQASGVIVPSPQSGWRASLDSLGSVIGLGLPILLVGTVVLGGIAFVNMWDLPLGLALAVLGYGLGLASKRGFSLNVGLSTLGALIVFAVLPYICYFWFFANYAPPVGGVLPNLFYPTRLSQYLVIFGIFIVPVVGFLSLFSHPRRNFMRRVLKLWLWIALLPLFVIACTTIVTYLRNGHVPTTGYQITPAVTEYLSGLGVRQVLSLALRIRAANLDGYLVSVTLVALCLGIVTHHFAPRTSWVRDQRRATDLFVAVLATLAFCIGFLVEIVYIGDFNGSRMNSVFKSYYQVWVMLAVAATYGLSRIFQADVPLRLRSATAALMVPLLAAGLFYPILAVPDRANYFRSQPSLDAMAYLRASLPEDTAAIDWIRLNVPASAVVLEASGVSWSQGHDNRVSTFTGHPTLLGWEVHELLWHGANFDAILQERERDIERIYRCRDGQELLRLLQKWHIDYVVMGGIERDKYHLTIKNGACLQDNLRTVFELGGLRIWAPP